MKFKFLSFLILATLAFTACQKNDFKKEDDKEDYKDEDGKEYDKEKCFDLVYPVTYTMADGSSITMDREDDWADIKAWYAAHPDSKADPVLEYPVEITSVKFDGVKVINNEEEMAEVKNICADGDDVKICDWDGTKVADPAVWEEHIVEPIVTTDDCGNCIVGGVVKYVKINTDFAYVVYYGKGECDEWAYLVTHYGATNDKKETKCKFKLDCDSGN